MDTDEEITFGKLYNTSRKWAIFFINFGLKKGDVVLLQFKNSWLHMAIVLACLYTGVKCTIIYEDEQRSISFYLIFIIE